MPTYEYQCQQCGPFEALRSIAQRNTPSHCPACGLHSHRVLLTAPRLGCLSTSQRTAHATNERAQHQPIRSADAAAGAGTYGRLKHPSNCGCCSTNKSRTTQTSPDGSKSFVGQRPWMISH